MITVKVQHSGIICLSDAGSYGLGYGQELNYDSNGGNQGNAWSKRGGSVDWDDDWSE